jgi:hypothetical protein
MVIGTAVTLSCYSEPPVTNLTHEKRWQTWTDPPSKLLCYHCIRPAVEIRTNYIAVTGEAMQWVAFGMDLLTSLAFINQSDHALLPVLVACTALEEVRRRAFATAALPRFPEWYSAGTMGTQVT